MELTSGQPSGKIVAELSQVSKRYGDKVIVQDFSTTIPVSYTHLRAHET